MEKLGIKQVITKKQLKQFINLPKKLYADDELWVPPLWLLENGDHKPGNNPVLRRSKHALFIAYKDNLPAGRIIAYIDPRYNSWYNTDTGMFGSFESIDHIEVSRLLYTAAEQWLRERGCRTIRGPINPVAESWGFLLQGNSAPVFMSPHNPLYYNSHINACGYLKAKDLLVYEADVQNGYRIPERFTDFADRLLNNKKNLSIRNVDRSNLSTDAVHIKNILNEAVAGNWGFVPVEDDEMKDIVEKLRLILDERAVCFVEDRGRPVAVALGFPDINVLFKKINGRLTPSGIYRLLAGRKRIRDYRLWGLAVLPAYQGLGLDVLLYVSLARQLTGIGCRMEANYMLEDNRDILNALEKMGMREIKRYRVYEKEL